MLLAGCQLSEETGPTTVDGGGEGAGSADAALGSPDREWPRTLGALQAVAEPEALTWQEEPVLADLTVWLESGEWDRVRLTYVAAASERMMTYRSDPEQLRVERPLLSGLQLPVLPREATEQLTPLPEGVLEPAALGEAAAASLAECGAAGEAVEAVLYATGAPAAWDGTTWRPIPTWRATVVSASAGVIVDPVTGGPFAPLTCVEPLLLDAG